MAAKLPYLTTPGTVTNALDRLKAAATPPTVNADFVDAKLKIKGGSGRAIPPFLKKVGFVAGDGTPTSTYTRFRNSNAKVSGAAAAEELGATDADRRAAFESWAVGHYAEYEEGRERGRVELDEQGLTLVKLFSLGRGTFVKHGPLRSLGPDSALVESRVRFGYAHIDLSSFSPGTTFYVCGVPVGRVYPIRVPTGSREVTVDVLDSVTIEWTLLRTAATETCLGGWKIAAARPVPGSEVAAEVTWIF